MIEHVSVGVSDLNRSARFYERTLAPLGLSRLVTRPATIGFGKNYPEFWINLRADMGEGRDIQRRPYLSSREISRRSRRIPCRRAGRRRPLGWRPGPAPARSGALLRGVHHRSRWQSHRSGEFSQGCGGIGIIKAGAPIRAPVSPFPRARATRRRVTAAGSLRPARLSEYRPEAKDE